MEKGLLFRLDDISPGLKRENLQEFERIFDKYNIKPLLGVVPDNRDPNLVVDEYDENAFWENLLRLHNKGWLIALHGYNHEYCTEDEGLLRANPFSEFAGVPYEKQLEIIRAGKKVLESKGLTVEGFMAPGHTFDENTLKALHENKIKYVTDGYTEYPYIREGLLFVPCKIDEASVPTGLDTLCIHLNNWTRSHFEKLESFLENNKEIIVSWENVLAETEYRQYDGKTKKEEQKYIKIRDMKRYASENVRMQKYLLRSYSTNKYIKAVKRLLYLPMLLKK